uniref:Uncharacterized protein n=1 Tax=Rhizophagus irregularis (strain DAOM 181602 / DAOM 197198 / MUCL 43194) TaxID=747089 RepID=U9TSF5_RHIID
MEKQWIDLDFRQSFNSVKALITIISTNMSRDISKKIEQYEKFLHDKLEVDLKQTWDLREKIYEEISD